MQCNVVGNIFIGFVVLPQNFLKHSKYPFLILIIFIQRMKIKNAISFMEKIKMKKEMLLSHFSNSIHIDKDLWLLEKRISYKRMCE